MQHKVFFKHQPSKPFLAAMVLCQQGIAGLTLSLTLLSPVAAQTTTFGVHTVSYHDRGYFNNVNTGVYLEHEGLTGGYYKNSLNKDSAYAGYTLKFALPTNPLFQSAAVMGGVVSGYRTKSYPHDYSLMAAFSLKHDFNEQHGLRLSILPTHSKSPANYVLHLSYELKMK
ncbi:MAG: hypothetical protein EBZ60_07800 [Betaproteobacteria bacterium]|nr:hypothetical protein [Betaproteobacteria bacterium]